MKKCHIFNGLGVLILSTVFSSGLLAAPPCKGPNKNDPGCPGAEEPPPEPSTAVLKSVTVDWYNQAIVARGSGFTESTEFILGGSGAPLSKSDLTDSQVNLEFDSNLAAEVTTQGSYNLQVDGTVVLAVYVEAPILDPLASDCPCEAAWAGLPDWDAPPATECLEIEGELINDAADISGTVLTNAADSSVYPHYPVGASFYPGQPLESYCTMVALDASATLTEIAHFPINELQQFTCAESLKLNVCDSVVSLP